MSSDLNDLVVVGGATLTTDGAEDFVEGCGSVDVEFDEEGAGCGVGVIRHGVCVAFV